MSADEKIFIGSKPILAYVTAVVTSFQRTDSVNIMARGRAISSAVDVVEVVVPDDRLPSDLKIGTERLGEAGAERNVSTILIKLSKPE